jgi:hypothetical protein
MNLVKAYKQGVTAPKHIKEQNDCSVRALANVSGKSYEDCQNLLKSLGRDQGFAVSDRTLAIACMKLGMQWKFIKSSVKAELPLGKYVILQQGHAYAYVDGNVLDNQKVDIDNFIVAYEYKG